MLALIMHGLLRLYDIKKTPNETICLAELLIKLVDEDSTVF